MPTLNLLYNNEYVINDKISVMIPSVGEVIDNEDSYYNLVSTLTAMPIDLMVQLDDIGIDFTSINDYDLFLILFRTLQETDTSLVFGDLDLSRFVYEQSEDARRVYLIDHSTGACIDRLIHNKIAATLRKINHIEKNRRKPGNEEAKQYMLQRARDKLKRHKNKVVESQLESLIIAMVNTEQFKYDFESVRNLSIYQFNESVRQVIKKVDYEHRMHGIYSGTVDPKNLSQDDLNWLIH